MKTLSLLLGFISFSSVAIAEFQTWTNIDGRDAELELLKVEDVEGVKIGSFHMKNDKVIKLDETKLSEESASKLKAWKPEDEIPFKGATSTKGSVFDKALDGNLLVLEGSKLKRYDKQTRPNKYYLFYYTASWCPPCQKFTPKLVNFYNKYKDNKDYEIILITSDGSKEDMEKYASNKQMTWPHLKLSRTKSFKRQFKHPGRGIPNLILTDLDGTLLKTSYEEGKYYGPTRVMNDLEQKLQ